MEKALIMDVTKENRTSKAGKPYVQYQVKYGDNFSINTIKTEFGDYLIGQKGKEIEWEIGQGQYGNEIKAIAGVEIQQRQGGGGGGRKYSPEDIARMEKRDKETKESIQSQTALKSADADMQWMFNLAEGKTVVTLEGYKKIKKEMHLFNLSLLEGGK